MTDPKLIYKSPKIVRDTLREAVAKADEIHQLEAELIQILSKCRNRFYVFSGTAMLRTTHLDAREQSLSFSLSS